VEAGTVSRPDADEEVFYGPVSADLTVRPGAGIERLWAVTSRRSQLTLPVAEVNKAVFAGHCGAPRTGGHPRVGVGDGVRARVLPLGMASDVLALEPMALSPSAGSGPSRNLASPAPPRRDRARS